MVLGAGMDDFKRGYEFGRFAIELAERSKDPSIICKVLWIFAAMIKPWRDPLDEIFPLVRSRAKAWRSTSAITNMSTTPSSASSFRGVTPRQQLCTKCYASAKSIGRSSCTRRTWRHTELSRCARNYALALQGKTAAPYSLSDGVYDETASELHYPPHRQPHPRLLPAPAQASTRVPVSAAIEEALALSDKGEAVVRSAVWVSPKSPTIISTADWPRPWPWRGPEANSAKHRKTLRHCLARLHLFAANSPHNFGQLRSLARRPKRSA